MLNYTIGAVRKKKTTAKKKATTRKPKVSLNCSTAGYNLKVVPRSRAGSRGGAILAMCKAVSEGKNLSAKAIKKYKVTKADLRKRK
jgi:hypothetical protein